MRCGGMKIRRRIENIWAWSRRRILERAEKILKIAQELNINDSADAMWKAGQIQEKAHEIVIFATKVALISMLLLEVRGDE